MMMKRWDDDGPPPSQLWINLLIRSSSNPFLSLVQRFSGGKQMIPHQTSSYWLGNGERVKKDDRRCWINQESGRIPSNDQIASLKIFFWKYLFVIFLEKDGGRCWWVNQEAGCWHPKKWSWKNCIASRKIFLRHIISLQIFGDIGKVEQSYFSS